MNLDSLIKFVLKTRLLPLRLQPNGAIRSDYANPVFLSLEIVIAALGAAFAAIRLHAMQGRKLLSWSQDQELSQYADQASDWLYPFVQSIRSHISFLTQLFTMTTTHKFS